MTWSCPFESERCENHQLLGERALGHWLMAPRDDAAVVLMRDGRWEPHPHPVDWVLRPPLVRPLAVRRDRHADLVAVVLAPQADCFAVSMPYAGETHYSPYLSLLGRDVAAGGHAQARARLIIAPGLSNDDVIQHYQHYELAQGASTRRNNPHW